MLIKSPLELKEKFRAASIHFLVTCLVASFSAVLIFCLWFPAPFTHIAGGVDLWGILVGVELALGPLMSLVIYSSKKSLRSLVIDYSLVGLVQFSALMFGISTLYSVRPVFMVFVKDRFELVAPVDFADGDWRVARSWRDSWVGPAILGVRTAEDNEENDELLFEAVLSGKDIHLRPKYYKRLELLDVKGAVKPISMLIEKLGDSKYEHLIVDLEKLKGKVWLHAVSGFQYWIAVVDLKDLSIVELYPIDAWELQ